MASTTKTGGGAQAQPQAPPEQAQVQLSLPPGLGHAEILDFSTEEGKISTSMQPSHCILIQMKSLMEDLIN